MQLGFVSAILGDLKLEEVLAFAADEGFPCVEIMCWPPGKAERRYAGVTHLDVTDFSDDTAAHVRDLVRIHGVQHLRPRLLPQPARRRRGAPPRSSSNTSRRSSAPRRRSAWTSSTRSSAATIRRRLADNVSRMPEVWLPVVKEAQAAGVKIGIEHCPMLYSADEWPGGKNLATTPAVWRQMFATFEAAAPGVVGLNFDPSHLVWQFIDCGRARPRVRQAHRPRPRQGRADRPRRGCTRSA